MVNTSDRSNNMRGVQISNRSINIISVGIRTSKESNNMSGPILTGFEKVEGIPVTKKFNNIITFQMSYD